MAEYVVNGAEPNETVLHGRTPNGYESWQWLPVRERIVRCRDCKFYTPESMTREERGFGVYEDVWEPGGCFNPERCSSVWDAVFEQMVPVGINTNPNGFCAWGCRKEANE